MDCADRATSVERVVAALPGIAAARVNFGAGTLSVVPESGTALRSDEIVAVVARTGYRAAVDTDAPDAALRDSLSWWRDRRLL